MEGNDAVTWRVEDEPWDDQGDLHIYSEADGTFVASVSDEEFGTEARNAHAVMIARAPEMLAMLRRVRETCHMSEDESLGPAIDILIARATEGVEPTDKAKEGDEDDPE